MRDINTPEEEIEFIIDNNATREKTVEQKSREAKALKEVEETLAKKDRQHQLAERSHSLCQFRHML